MGPGERPRSAPRSRGRPPARIRTREERRNAETTVLRRSAAAEVARTCIPGAVFLFAAAGAGAPRAGPTAVRRRPGAGGGPVNVPGRDVEVGDRLSIFPQGRDRWSEVRGGAGPRSRDHPLWRTAAADVGPRCVPGAVVLYARVLANSPGLKQPPFSSEFASTRAR